MESCLKFNGNFQICGNNTMNMNKSRQRKQMNMTSLKELNMTFRRESDIMNSFPFIKYEFSYLFENSFFKKHYIYLRLGILKNKKTGITENLLNSFNRLKNKYLPTIRVLKGKIC